MKIRVEGYYIERFINICRTQKILIWNIKRKGSSQILTNVGKKDFKKLKKIAKTTGCRLKIEHKKGMPFVLNKYKKRKIFAISLLAILTVIFVLSNFVWNIEVVGNEKISTKELLMVLEENGLKVGVFKTKVDSKKIINAIRLQRSDLAWVGMELIGTNAIVKIVEADPKPDIINEEEYCNIVSDKVGMITKITAQDGTSLVKEGDIVKNGDVLIGGWLEGKYTGTRYVHAKGEIQAKVWYSKKGRMDLKIEKNQPTGQEENAYAMSLNNFQINLPKRVPKFENYDTIVKKEKLKIFSNFYFPIQFQTTTYVETKKEVIQYSKEEAKQILIQALQEELKQEIEEQENIVNTQINYKDKSTYIEVEVIYEVLEHIGTKEKLIF